MKISKGGNVGMSEKGEKKDESQNDRVDKSTTGHRPIASGPQIEGMKDAGQLSSTSELQID